MGERGGEALGEVLGFWPAQRGGGELFAGKEKRVEEADLGSRFLIFQGRWDLGGLLAECQGHKREGGTCRVPNPVPGPQKVHK